VGLQVFEDGIPVIEYQLAAGLGEADGPFVPQLLHGGGGGDPQQPHGLFPFNPLVVLDALLFLQTPHDLLDQGIEGLGFEADDIEAVGEVRHGVKIKRAGDYRKSRNAFPCKVHQIGQSG
jgi:hypothetical protein